MNNDTQQVALRDMFVNTALVDASWYEIIGIAAIPCIAAITTTWCIVWLAKVINRANGNTPFLGGNIILSATVVGACMGVFMQWAIGGLIGAILHYDVLNLKGVIACGLVAGVFTVPGWILLMWFIRHDFDLMFIKKAEWPALYETLRVRHKSNIDYGYNGEGDLTRFTQRSPGDDNDDTPTPQ